ncbi:MAG: type II toxin-antitoxin system VapC family toxin [Nitrospirae bacterium]|nr:type II toxin-antitoxin system VapC family toxin [Nitrospirota bacterium]
MKQKAYLETSIISYLAARPSRDIIIAAHQELTNEWWENRRKRFDLFVSQLVIQESKAGDKNAAQKRLDILGPIPLLELNEKVISLARILIDEALPPKAVEDALHIAVAAIHGMDYLLTWNCKHIANAEKEYAIAAVCRSNNYEPPIICTPEELMGG